MIRRQKGRQGLEISQEDETGTIHNDESNWNALLVFIMTRIKQSEKGSIAKSVDDIDDSIN